MYKTITNITKQGKSLMNTLISKGMKLDSFIYKHKYETLLILFVIIIVACIFYYSFSEGFDTQNTFYGPTGYTAKFKKSELPDNKSYFIVTTPLQKQILYTGIGNNPTVFIGPEKQSYASVTTLLNGNVEISVNNNDNTMMKFEQKYKQASNTGATAKKVDNFEKVENDELLLKPVASQKKTKTVIFNCKQLVDKEE